jgi:hypothetical protein
MMRRFTIVSAFAFIFAAAAQAQQPAPAAPSQPAAVAPHGCPKAGEHPGRLASDNQRRAWVKNANAYLECLKKYINEHQGAYNAAIEKAKPHMDAANATIDEYNKAVAAFKAENESSN